MRVACATIWHAETSYHEAEFPKTTSQMSEHWLRKGKVPSNSIFFNVLNFVKLYCILLGLNVIDKYKVEQNYDKT